MNTIILNKTTHNVTPDNNLLEIIVFKKFALRNVVFFRSKYAISEYSITLSGKEIIKFRYIELFKSEAVLLVI